jgi:hypothetical protein
MQFTDDNGKVYILVRARRVALSIRQGDSKLHERGGWLERGLKLFCEFQAWLLSEYLINRPLVKAQEASVF